MHRVKTPCTPIKKDPNQVLVTRGKIRYAGWAIIFFIACIIFNFSVINLTDHYVS